jgi:hypothetical protein
MVLVMVVVVVVVVVVEVGGFICFGLTFFLILILLDF